MHLCDMHYFLQQHQRAFFASQGIGFDSDTHEMYVLVAEDQSLEGLPKTFNGEPVSYRVRDDAALHGVREV